MDDKTQNTQITENPATNIIASTEPTNIAVSDLSAESNIKNKSFTKIIVIASLIFIATLLIFTFILKPLIVLNNMSRGSEIGLAGDSYHQIKKDCPANIELTTTCLRSFYTENSTVNVKETINNSLMSKGYLIKELPNGYDGPDQKALVAYNAKKNVTLVVVILDTDNKAYKQYNGNVRVEAYSGEGKYAKY